MALCIGLHACKYEMDVVVRERKGGDGFMGLAPQVGFLDGLSSKDATSQSKQHY